MGDLLGVPKAATAEPSGPKRAAMAGSAESRLWAGSVRRSWLTIDAKDALFMSASRAWLNTQPTTLAPTEIRWSRD